MRGFALLVSALVCACASGNTSVPELTPAETEALYARYSGSWTLREDQSDPASVALETSARVTRSGDPVHRPEMSSRTLRPTYQRAGQARALVAGQMDRTAMRQTILMAGKRPHTLRIQLSAQGMEVTYDGGDPWMLPADGSSVEVQGDLTTTRIRLAWENGIPIIEREIDKSGVIREILETAPNGRSLWLTRQVVMGTEGWQPAQFTYGR